MLPPNLNVKYQVTFKQILLSFVNKIIYEQLNKFILFATSYLIFYTVHYLQTKTKTRICLHDNTF